MTVRDCLIAACLARPRDAAPRMALADHLEESGRLDHLQASALGGRLGWWSFDATGRLHWFFRPTARLCPPPYGHLLAARQVAVLIGRVPKAVGPRCAECGGRANLFFRRTRWVCGQCRAVRAPRFA